MLLKKFTQMTKTSDCRVTLLWLPLHSIKENMEGELRREQMLQWCVKRLEPLTFDTKMSMSSIFLLVGEGKRKVDYSCMYEHASSTFLFLDRMLILPSCLRLECFYSKV